MSAETLIRGGSSELWLRSTVTSGAGAVEQSNAGIWIFKKEPRVQERWRDRPKCIHPRARSVISNSGCEWSSSWKLIGSDQKIETPQSPVSLLWLSSGSAGSMRVYLVTTTSRTWAVVGWERLCLPLGTVLAKGWRMSICALWGQRTLPGSFIR